MLSLALGFGLLWFLLIGVLLVFEIWMFVALLQNQRLDGTVKLLWAIGMLLFHPFVAIAYYFVEYTRR